MSTKHFAFPMVTPVTKCASMKSVHTSNQAGKDNIMSASTRLSRHIALLAACAMALAAAIGCTPVESFLAAHPGKHEVTLADKVSQHALRHAPIARE